MRVLATSAVLCASRAATGALSASDEAASDEAAKGSQMLVTCDGPVSLIHLVTKRFATLCVN